MSSPAPVPPSVLPVPYTIYTAAAPGPLGAAPLGYVQRPGYVVYPTVASMWYPAALPPFAPPFLPSWPGWSRSRSWSRSGVRVVGM